MKKKTDGPRRRALSIRQPYAEMILRGMKTVEYRSRPTRIIGERFYIYAPRKPGAPDGFETLGVEPGDLPTGVIVGSAIITECARSRTNGHYEWRLAEVNRARRQRKPSRMPQPIWFWPF